MTLRISAGVATVDITPPDGLSMSGYAIRTGPATGTHDPLTARALAVADTAILAVDVIGLDADMCQRIRERATLPTDKIIVAATHTHGGPITLKRGLGVEPDRDYLIRLENACVEAIDRAAGAQRPAQLQFGVGGDPAIGDNRRHENGPVDHSLPVLRIRGDDGEWIAVLVAYACHPVVLGPDNLQWTADYPGFVRTVIETAHPGAVGIFVTGCAADTNTGHTAKDSMRPGPSPDRTFAVAEKIGQHIATCVLNTSFRPIEQTATCASAQVPLDLARGTEADPDALAITWRHRLETAPPDERPVLEIWINWAETVASDPLEPVNARVVHFNWGGVDIIALPGEIFAATAAHIRASVPESAKGNVIIVGYADGCPGYIAPAEEYDHGGYEIEEAHRYYGMPAAFARGSAERLAESASRLIDATNREFSESAN